MKKIIKEIIKKHRVDGIEVKKPATDAEIFDFECKIDFPLPYDFKKFYQLCNGFECNEDIFNITPLSEIIEYGQEQGIKWYYFSEYMMCSDMWGLRLTVDGEYQIFNGSSPDIVLTDSLEEFLSRFLQGNVFDKGGLYEWVNE